jgi:fructose-1,6-bisphosphatase/inositol monophosphatase family enzyme
MEKNLKDILISAMRAAYNVHENLGVDGEALVHKNQFGDTALRADVECEQAVLQILRENNTSIRVISEEHGTTIIGETPKYLGVLDGIDGSYLYKKARGKKQYGTMFAIFNSIDPIYDDYVVCGIMQHATNRIFIAEKDHGARIIEGNRERVIHTSKKKLLDANINIYIDEYFDYNKKAFSRHLKEFKPKYEGASSLYYAALAEGSADLVLECTRKGNLEIAVEYGLTKEAGGAVLDINGQNLGGQKYLTFGQNGHLGIISAASQDLALELLKKISV